VARAKLPLGARTYHCEHCGMILDRNLNAARNLAKLTKTIVAGSGSETLNARPSTQ
jgi:transposase